MDYSMMQKEQVITQIVALVREHHISLEELSSALGRQQIEANKKDAFTLTRLFSYLGGIFILAGLSTYIGLSWNSLNSFARIVITLGPGIICLIMAIVTALQNKRENNVTIFIILSALLQCTGLFVTIAEFATGGGDLRVAELAVFGVLAFQYGLLFLKLKRTSILFFTIYFSIASFVNFLDLIHVSYHVIEFICGASFLALSYGIQRTPYNSICGLGYFISSISLLWVGFDLLKNSEVEVLYFGIASFMLYVSTIVRSRSILASSTIAILSYISYYTSEHFLNSIGWPLCLVLLGLIFFGVSHVALKLNKRFE
jgi:Predicted membrane protein (DUF2157)